MIVNVYSLLYIYIEREISTRTPNKVREKIKTVDQVKKSLQQTNTTIYQAHTCIHLKNKEPNARSANRMDMDISADVNASVLSVIAPLSMSSNYPLSFCLYLSLMTDNNTSKD
jgi:predicted butyrate kinase (DUF1464 family)